MEREQATTALYLTAVRTKARRSIGWSLERISASDSGISSNIKGYVPRWKSIIPQMKDVAEQKDRVTVIVREMDSSRTLDWGFWQLRQEAFEYR